jgi:hypothetical protein
MSDLKLTYRDDGFAVRARKLIGNRQTFFFQVVGEERNQLEAFIINGVIKDPAKLGLRPKLQVLLGILMLAEAQGQAVSFEVGDEAIGVWVGVAKS